MAVALLLELVVVVVAVGDAAVTRLAARNSHS